jgi:SAM-dependent methyltransferase
MKQSLSGMTEVVTIEPLIQELRALVDQRSAHLLRTFDVFAQEARSARQWLESDLNRLASGASILEVGAGLMILSCQLVIEGYRVTSLEPLADGFSEFSELQSLILNHAKIRNYAPNILSVGAEDLNLQNAFDFSFSVNVMEHVKSIPQSLQNIIRALRPSAIYRFNCPNYLFPYEPHFNIPTLISKKLTWIFFSRQILGSKRISQSIILWESLNWITVFKVKKIANSLPNVSVSFGQNTLYKAFERVVSDKEFAIRRSKWVVSFARIIVKLGLHHTAKLIPPHFQPLMDCRMIKNA